MYCFKNYQKSVVLHSERCLTVTRVDVFNTSKCCPIVKWPPACLSSCVSCHFANNTNANLNSFQLWKYLNGTNLWDDIKRFLLTNVIGCKTRKKLILQRGGFAKALAWNWGRFAIALSANQHNTIFRKNQIQIMVIPKCIDGPMMNLWWAYDRRWHRALVGGAVNSCCQHSWKKCFFFQDPVFWGRNFLIWRRKFA